MSKTTKSSKKQAVGYIGCVYGGIMKQGHVRYFVTSEDVEDHFETFKEHYGSEVRGRYVKTTEQDKFFEEVKEKVSDNHIFGDIYELSVDSSIRAVKEVTGVKKASLLGEDHEDKADKGAETEPEEEVETKKSKKEAKDVKESKDKKTSKTETETKTETKQKKVAKKIEVESEDEPSDAEDEGSESEAESEPEEKPKKKAGKKESKDKEEEKPAKTTKAKGKSK